MKLLGPVKKFPPIERCAASRTDPRVQLQHAYLDAERARLVATDGQVLAVLPVEVSPGESSGFIPAAGLAAARKGRVTEIQADSEAVRLPGGQAFARASASRFPDYERVVPTTEEYDIAIDAADLLRLAKAVCGGQTDAIVRLSFGRDGNGQISPAQGIKVRPYNVDDDAVGVILPYAPAGRRP